MDWTAVVVALVSVAVGWILSLLTQQRQHALDLRRFDREQQTLQENALRRRGEELADEIIDCLLLLREMVPQTVWGKDPDAEVDEVAERELARLRALALRHPSEPVRVTVELAHELLQWPDDIVIWGNENYRSPREVVWHTCQQALDVVGQFVRGEAVDASSEELDRLRRAQEVTLSEKQAQWEEEDRARR